MNDVTKQYKLAIEYVKLNISVLNKQSEYIKYTVDRKASEVELSSWLDIYFIEYTSNYSHNVKFVSDDICACNVAVNQNDNDATKFYEYNKTEFKKWKKGHTVYCDKGVKYQIKRINKNVYPPTVDIIQCTSKRVKLNVDYYKLKKWSWIICEPLIC